MVATYSIFVVNQSADTQNFWCFLAPPPELANDPGVYANSSASLLVISNSPVINYFAIPVQYTVGAGASNDSVGLNVTIVSNVTNYASLGDTWEADYADAPPQQGPTMQLLGTTGPANTISISSNAFNMVQNENAGWFANQSFGIQSAAGFVGMSWSPAPQQQRTLTPQLSFYIAIGDYGTNALASWDQVSNNAALVSVPGSFQYADCTVTYMADGSWTVSPGKPPAMLSGGNAAALSPEPNRELTEVSGNVQVDYVIAVHWNSSGSEAAEFTYLTGTLTVLTALVAPFAFMVLAGVEFSVQGAIGATTVNFTYSGALSAQYVRDLFVAGAEVFFGGGG